MRFSLAPVLLLLLAALPWRAAAAATADAADFQARQSAMCLDAVAAAERAHGTPPGLLGTIARVESGRPLPPSGRLQPWPWTIDADGQGYFFDSRDAAVAWAKQGLERGVRAMDVGCLQVDLQQHPEAFATLDQAFDPGANAAYAARFLRALHDGPADGNWFTATGYYHSQTPELAAQYRDMVTAVAAGRPLPAYGQLPLYLRALKRGAVLLSLAGGGRLEVDVNRQPTRRAVRRLDPCQVAAVLGPYLHTPPRDCGRAAARRIARD